MIRFLLLLCVSLGAQAASFDCKKSTNNVETTICSDPYLSQQDETLAAVYEHELSESKDKSSLKSDQRAWIAARNRCKDKFCLQSAYTNRLLSLGCAKGSYIVTAHECVRLELNVVENELMPLQLQYTKKIIAESDNPEHTKELTETEILKWREYRDAKCDLYGSGEGGTPGWKSTWSSMCQIGETKARIEQFRKEIGQK